MIYYVVVLIDDVVSKGVILVIGGVLESGMIMVFIIVDGVMFEMDIYVVESFGFVIIVICVKDIEDVVCIVNDMEYGLIVVVYGCNICCVFDIVC